MTIEFVSALLGIAAIVVGVARWLWTNRPVSSGKPILIFVSMGGTCRDPMAAAIAKYLLAGRNPQISVEAAGILRGHMKGASPGARQIVRQRLGVDSLKNHKSRMLSAPDIKRAKLILTMSVDNKTQILKANPDISDKVYTVKEFLGLRGDVKNPYVPDDLISPAAMERYSKCYDELERLLSAPGNIDKIYNAVVA